MEELDRRFFMQPQPQTEAVLEYVMPIGVMSSADQVHGGAIKKAAQQLHTDVYLKNDIIDETQVSTESGLFLDEYSDRSVYLLSETEHRRSACRYIHADKKGGMMSLPTAQHFAVDPETIKQAAGIRRLTDLRAKEVIEISGLVSDLKAGGTHDRRGELDATRLLYASILRRSLDEGHKLWLLNVEPALFRSLKLLIGEEQVHSLGEAAAYMGPATIPVAINPQEVVRAAFADETDAGDMKRQYLLETLPGVSTKHLPKDIMNSLMEYDIPYDEGTGFERVKRRATKHHRLLAYAAILGYSAGRPLIANGVEEFHGSVPVLWGIDVATAIPYTWGVLETVAPKGSVKRRIGAAAVAVSTFCAPYVYFEAEGHDYPVYVNAAVGAFVGYGALAESLRVRKDHKIAAALQAPLTAK